MDGGSFRAYTAVMIQENLQRLRTRLEQAPDLDAETRQRTLELVEELAKEVAALPADQPASADRVRSALGLAESAAAESTANSEEPGLTSKAASALDEAVLELEASHPDAARLIGQISYVLSRMGL